MLNKKVSNKFRIKVESRFNDLYILPSNNIELVEFIEKNKSDMTEHTVKAIEYALNHKLPLVEIFQFKNSNFVITLTEKDFKPNLEIIYKYYLELEKYEYCNRVVKLQKLLTKV
jgi:hypothetical protein